jgi:2,3-dihydroxybenzoate decarboxylase
LVSDNYIFKKSPREANSNMDTPYDQIEEAQAWWRAVDIDPTAKEMVAGGNAIKLFKLPLKA